MSGLMRHPAMKAIAVMALVGCALSCAVPGAILLLGGSVAAYIGFVFEVLPRATGLGLVALVLGVMHFGLALALTAAAELLRRDRALTFVLICCGLTAMLGIGTIKLTASNSWSHMAVLGSLVAGGLALAISNAPGPERLPGSEQSRGSTG
jgi:hypothetical protein